MVGYPPLAQYPDARRVAELLLGLYDPVVLPETGSGYVPVYHTGAAVMPVPVGPRPAGEVLDHAKLARSTGSVPLVTVSRLIISAV